MSMRVLWTGIERSAHPMQILQLWTDQGPSKEVDDYKIAFHCRAMLHSGFTTVRDLGGATRKHKEATASWLIPGPRLFIGGPIISQTGGHGAYPLPFHWPPVHGVQATLLRGTRCRLRTGVSSREKRPSGVRSLTVASLTRDAGRRAENTADACLKVARKLMAQGADHLKVCTSGGVLSQMDRLESVQFTAPEIKAITETCRNMVSPSGCATR